MKRSRYFETAVRMDEALLSLLDEKEFEYITVKEICARAKVDRSTFYLHYETVGDLLGEAIALIGRRFYESYPLKLSVEDKPLDELFFITDEWILPYLRFASDNRRAYRALHGNAMIFETEKAFKQMFSELLSPILTRFGVDEDMHEYVMTFYRQGLTAIVMRWVENDCAAPPERIAEMIKLLIPKR